MSCRPSPVLALVLLAALPLLFQVPGDLPALRPVVAVVEVEVHGDFLHLLQRSAAGFVALGLGYVAGAGAIWVVAVLLRRLLPITMQQ